MQTIRIYLSILFLFSAFGMFAQKNAEQLYSQAEGLIARQEYRQAQDVLKKLVAQTPAHTDGRLRLGVLYCYLGDTITALQQFAKVLTYDPKYAPVYAYRAAIYQHQRKYGQVVSELDAYLKLKPMDAYYYAMRASSKHRLGRYPEALADYTKAIQVDPKNDTLYVSKALAVNFEEGAAKALPVLEECLKKNPSSVYALDRISYLHIELEDFAGVVNDMNRLLELDPQHSAAHYYSRGRAQHLLGKRSEGCDDLEKARELGNKEAFLYMEENCVGVISDAQFLADVFALRAERYAQKGLYEQARGQYGMAIEKTPEADALYYFRGRTSYLAGDYKAARADMERAIAGLTGNPDRIKTLAAAKLMYGQCSIQLGEPDEAKTAIREAVNLAPDEVMYHHVLALLCLDIHDYAGTLEAISRAAQLDPKNAQYQVIMGEAYLGLNDKIRACEAFNRAKTLGDRNVFANIIIHCQ